MCFGGFHTLRWTVERCPLWFQHRPHPTVTMLILNTEQLSKIFGILGIHTSRRYEQARHAV